MIVGDEAALKGHIKGKDDMMLRTKVHPLCVSDERHVLLGLLKLGSFASYT